MPIAKRLDDLMDKAHRLDKTYAPEDARYVMTQCVTLLKLVAQERFDISETPVMNRTRKEKLRMLFLDYAETVINDLYREAYAKKQ